MSEGGVTIEQGRQQSGVGDLPLPPVQHGEQWRAVGLDWPGEGAPFGSWEVGVWRDDRAEAQADCDAMCTVDPPYDRVGLLRRQYTERIETMALTKPTALPASTNERQERP